MSTPVLSVVYLPLGKHFVQEGESENQKRKDVLVLLWKQVSFSGFPLKGARILDLPLKMADLQLTLTFSLLASCSSEPTVLPPGSNPSFGWQSGDSLGHSLSLIFVFCFECIHVALGKQFHISESQFAIYKQRQMDRAMLFFFFKSAV